MTASGPAPVTVLIDKDDHPAWPAAALAAHHPELGRITLHPAPANGAPAALAHDLLYALGKRLPAGGETYGTWADSQRPAWDAATAWTLAHGIDQLIVCRTDRLTPARFQQLLALRERCGIRLTLLWHRSASTELATLLDGIEHQVINDLPQAHTAFGRPGPQPTGGREPGPYRPSGRLPPGHDVWITPAPPSRRVRVPRPPRTPCPGADPATLADATEPEHGDGHAPTAVLAARLGQVAHPLYSAALAIHEITGASLECLTWVRGTDIDRAATVLKIHDSRAHQRCWAYRVPAWASPLLAAATTFHHLSGRAPDSVLFPLITARNSEQLTAHATAIRYILDNTPRQTTTPTNTRTHPCSHTRDQL